MIKIFSQYQLERSNVDDMTELNQAFNDGYRTVGVMAGFGHDEDSWVDGLLILHKPDETAPAPSPIKRTSTSPSTITLHDDEKEFDAAQATIEDFYELVRGNDFVVLDTETTGILDAEICQIAIIDSDGNELLNTLVKPSQPIPEGATRIHGISNDGVKDAPTWSTVQPLVRDILRGKNVVIYNAKFDRKLMHWSDEKAGLPHCDYKAEATYWDAMEFYAEFNGDWSDYHQSYTWQKLTVAAARFGIETKHAHTALADCKMTLEVIKRMAQQTVGE